MFNNEVVARQRAEQAAFEVIKGGSSSEAAERMFDAIYKEELARLDKWSEDNVGMN